jgi:outer membrane lipase/esterase
MRQTYFALAVLAAAVLSACGGSDGTSPAEQQLKTTFSAMVSFGDSLADVGTYQVGAIKAAGGGKFTINGDNTSVNPTLNGKNWTELLAKQFGLPAPCAAQTGLEGNAAAGLAVAIVDHPECLSYAQGGARVSNPVGPQNKATGSAVGYLTKPVLEQVTRHLAKTGGKFSGTEVVFVTVGGNDVLALLDETKARATAAGLAAGAAEGAKVGAETFAPTLVGLLAATADDPQSAAQAIGGAVTAESLNPAHTTQSIINVAVGTAMAQPGSTELQSDLVVGSIVVKAKTTAEAAGAAAGAIAGQKAGDAYAASQAPAMVTAMGVAGAELAAIVKTMIVAKGANYVVVNNLPDLGGSPAAKALGVPTQTLVNTMVATFNAQLQAGVAGESKALYVDLWATSHDQIINPVPYGLTNTDTAACTVESLVCTGKTLIAGDVSHFMFADGVLPTPYENSLTAKFVAERMIVKGWL